MIKVRQNINTVLDIENKEIKKLTNELKKDFKTLFDIKIKLENENKKLKAIAELAKVEYQKLNNENEENKKHIGSYKDYLDGLTQQIEELNNRMREYESQNYCERESIRKKQRYLVRQPEAIDVEIYDGDDDERYIYVD